MEVIIILEDKSQLIINCDLKTKMIDRILNSFY